MIYCLVLAFAVAGGFAAERPGLGGRSNGGSGINIGAGSGWGLDSTNSAEDRRVTREVDVLVAAAHRAYERDDAVKRYQRLVSRLAADIKKRRLSGDQEFISRYKEFVDYVEAASLGQLSDHELGFNVPDGQYFDETRQYVQIPEMLTDQKFLHWVSRYETLGRAKAYLRQLNSTRTPAGQLLFFSYTSQHLGAADNDNSFRRLLIVVPGNREKNEPDKWVQFSVTDPRAHPRVRNTSVVSAVMASDGTYNAYFKDFFRTFHRDGTITIKGRWELGEGDDNCAQCHKSGVLPIFPQPGSVSPDEEAALAAVNQRFMTYGSPRFGNYLDEAKFGPGLSTASADSRDMRFGPDFDESAVGQAMTCAGCHRPQGLGALNWPMDRTVISSFIEGGKMPLGATLSDDERSRLYKDLIEEYFAVDDSNPGVLQSWLLGKDRSAPRQNPSPSH